MAFPTLGILDGNGDPQTINTLPDAAAHGGLPIEGVASGVAVPISAASLPLPSGAATATLQGGGLPAALGAGGGLKVDGSGTALPISAAALPLPSGAATSTLQGGGLPAALAAHGGLVVEGVASGVPVPVSGTFYQATQPVKGTGFVIPVTLTVTNGAYSVADVAGGLITFANACSAAGKSAIINTIILSGVVANPYELWFFPSDIATPAADNAAFTLVAADVAMCKGVIAIAAGDYNAPQSAFNVATLRGVGLQYSCTATSLYAYLKAVAVTSPGTTTLTLTIKGEFID